MSREKRKVYEKIKKGFSEDIIAGSKLRKDLPLLATNLNNPKHLEFLFNEYKKEGLIPKKLGKDIINNAKDLTRYLQKRIYGDWDRIVKKDPTIKGDKGFRNAYFTRERTKILNEIVQNEAISKLTKAQRTPEQLEQISKMRWKGLPIKISSSGELSFNRRYFHDKVSQRIIDFAEKIEPGLGKKWAKEMRASWNAIGERNRAIKAASGIGFDIGHFIPSVLDAPNVGSNAAPELLGPNRSKGGTPFTNKRSLARQLAIPESWAQAFTDWHLREQGMDPNLLPKDYQLKGGQVVDSATGYSDPNAEIFKNQAKFKKDQELIDVVESYKQQGLIPPETTVVGDGTKIPQIESIDDLAPYGKIQPDLKIVDDKVIKAARNTPQQTILKVLKNVKHTSNLIPTPVGRSVLTAAALAPGALGTAASAADVIERGARYEKSKNWLDGIQLGLANASLFTGWTGAGEIVATPADLLNLGLDAARFGTIDADTSMRKRYRHGVR